MDIEQSLQQAVEHYAAGRIPEALELCLAVLDQAGDNVDALHLGGLLAFQQGQAETAANLIWKAVQLDPGFLDAYLNLGQIYRSLGREQDAVACFRKALDLAPGHAEALALLGEEAPAAAPQEEQMATMSLPDALRFATERHQAGDLPQAEAVYLAVLDSDPNNVDALHLLGILRAQQSRFGEGIELMQRAVTLSPNAEIYRNLGQALVNSGKPEEAQACFAKARELGH